MAAKAKTTTNDTAPATEATTTADPVNTAPRITTAVPLPKVTRGATNKYPFDELPAPTVVIDDKTGEPVMGDDNLPLMQYSSFPVYKDAKKMQSTVYSAAMRFAREVAKNEKGKPVYERSRDFRVYNVDRETDPDKAVARVFRIK